MFDGEAFGAEIVAVVRAYVDGATAGLKAEVAALRAQIAAQAAPRDGRDGVDGAPGEKGEPGEKGDAGPIGPPGEAGLDGLDGKPGRDGVDGRGATAAVIDREGCLQLTFSDGSTANVGQVVGRDGVDGRDGRDGVDGAPGERGERGFGLDDFDVDQTDERTVVLSFTRGDTVERYELHFPVLLDRGVFNEGRAYEKGDAVSWGHQLWIAQRDTADKPGEGSDAWRLAVRRGRDGKDGKDGAPGPEGPMGAPGRDGKSWGG